MERLPQLLSIAVLAIFTQTYAQIPFTAIDSSNIQINGDLALNALDLKDCGQICIVRFAHRFLRIIKHDNDDDDGDGGGYVFDLASTIGSHEYLDTEKPLPIPSWDQPFLAAISWTDHCPKTGSQDCSIYITFLNGFLLITRQPHSDQPRFLWSAQAQTLRYEWQRLSPSDQYRLSHWYPPEGACLSYTGVVRQAEPSDTLEDFVEISCTCEFEGGYYEGNFTTITQEIRPVTKSCLDGSVLEPAGPIQKISATFLDPSREACPCVQMSQYSEESLEE